MDGKTVVITGSSRGLGYVTARSLAQKGALVYMLNRKSDRAEKSLAEIVEVCTGPPPQLIECDLLDFTSVRKAAAILKKKCTTTNKGIDVLCCNAGIMLQPDQASKDGYDITIATNVLSHFLLTKELIPELEEAASLRGEARIVSMSSMSGFGPPAFDPTFFGRNGGKLGDGTKASYARYHQSKLANLIFTSTLDDRLRAKKSNVRAVACTPGVCGTDMFVHATTVMSGSPSPRNMVPSTEDGALAQIKCICDPSVESGELWNPSRMTNASEDGGSPVEKAEIQLPSILVDNTCKEKLWKLCEQAIGVTFEL